MPALDDDGQTIALDLHGCTVNEALGLTERTVREAARRGRARMKVIHGASTSDPRYRNRTIKHALYDLLDDGALDEYVSDVFRAEDYALLSLDISARRDPAPLRLRDVF